MIQKPDSEMNKQENAQNGYAGISSGFSELDQMTGGFQKGELIVISSRPAIGKTAFALSMVQHIALKEKISCGFFSLEMSASQIMQRCLAQVSGVPSEKIREETLSQAQRQSITDASAHLSEALFYLVDTSGLKLFDLLAQAQSMVSEHQVKIIFIDYVGLIVVDGELKLRPQEEQRAEILRSLKHLAQELNISIVALYQISKDETSVIAQDADTMISIQGEQGDGTPIIERNLILAKHRSGATGTIKIAFHKKITKFEDWTSREQWLDKK